MSLRRSPEVILAAHEFDQERRELYVEGVRDRVFLNWLVHERQDPNALVVCIDDVDIPDPHTDLDEDSYGNRERVIELMRIVDGHAPRIRGFIDRDQDHLVGAAALTRNVWVSDFRDMESYVLFEENLDQVLRAGAGTESVEASNMLTSLFDTATFLAAARLVSQRNAYRFPVGSAKWERHIRAVDGVVTSFDGGAVLRQLVQNSAISLTTLPSITDEVNAALSELEELDPRMRVQGKDAMRIVRIQLKSIGIEVTEAFHILGPTFRRESISKFPQLRSTANFVALAV